MSYGYFLKYDPEVMRVFQIHEHHAKIVKLGRYANAILKFMLGWVTETFYDCILLKYLPLSERWSC